MGVAARVVFGLLALGAGVLFVGRDPVAALGHAVALWLICWIGQQGAQRSALWLVLGVVAYAIAFVWMPIVPLALLFVGERFTRPRLVKGGRVRPAPPGRPGPRMQARPAPSRSRSPVFVVYLIVLIAVLAGLFVAYRASLPRKLDTQARDALAEEFANFGALEQAEINATVEAAHESCFGAALQLELVSARFDGRGYRACIDKAVGTRLGKVLTLHSPEFSFDPKSPRWWRVSYVIEGQGDAIPEQLIERRGTNCEGQGEQLGESPTSLSLSERIDDRRYRSTTQVFRDPARCHHSLVLAYRRWSLGPPLEFDTPPPSVVGEGEAVPMASR
jgi:hypothetical protein